MKQESTCIRACNTLLREHLLAIATYQEALEVFAFSPKKHRLEKILRIHKKSAADLRSTLENLDARPAKTDGAWFHLERSAPSMQNDLAGCPQVRKLLQLEEHALDSCEKILAMPGLEGEAADCIRNTVIPRFQKNIALLESLQSSVLRELPVDGKAL